MITRLRSLFPTASKPYLITGAPQCVVPDANMGVMIANAQFDILFVQYYNTPECSARNWVSANPNYASTGVEKTSGFSYSANAKLYIGVPGDVEAAASTDYLTPTEISSLIEAYYCKPNFGKPHFLRDALGIGILPSFRIS
jgi:chitinase